MTSSTPDLVQAHRDAVVGLERISTSIDAHRALDDTELLELSRLVGRQTQLIGALRAVVAGEVAHRSDPLLGSRGLAQRTGYRTPEELVKVTTGSTGRDASTSVRIGRLAHEAATAGRVDEATGEVAIPTQPWLQPVAAAVTAAVAGQSLSVEAADAIRRGLGTPNTAVTVTALTGAATLLVAEASLLDPDRLTRHARQLRDELDHAGIAVREEERWRLRSLTLIELPDGGGLLTWRMDPETFALVKETYDRATSPKRGGPRFSTRDAVTTGSGAPTIRIAATRSAFHTGTGHGRIEGQPDPISVDTITRLACDGGTTSVIFDDTGRPLDVGREQRLFTRRQRIALAIRDGGCRWPGCHRPPSWCEAHHIVHWKRDNGNTNTDDGTSGQSAP